VRAAKAIAEHEVQTVALADIQSAPYNPRTITPKAREGLRASMRRFGNVQPIVINKRSGHLIGGHQRVSLLKEVGETHTQAIIVDLPLSEEKALNIALNSRTVTGVFDNEQLGDLLNEIQADDADLFRDLNLDDLLNTMPKIDEVDADVEDDEPEKAPLQKVVSYQIVFDDEVQQQKFYVFLSALRKWYPDLETMGARIAQYCEDALAAGAPA